jgi:opacity protein-like surface antigen
MYQRLPLLLIATALLSAPAFAQKTPFEGLSLGLNAVLDSSSTELGPDAQRLSGLGWTTQGASIQGAWGWPVGESSIFSVGATYHLSDISSGDSNTNGGAFSLKRHSAYSVYMEPGFKLSNQTLVYATVGYEAANMRLDTSTGGTEQSIEGAGYGVGMRSYFSKHGYVQVEIKQLDYRATHFPDQTANFKASATEGLLGVGYQF